MNCKYCGAELQAEDMFCAVCGQKVVSETPPTVATVPAAESESTANEKLNGVKTVSINKKALIIASVVFAIVLLVSIGLSILKNQYDPKKTAEKFAQTLFMQDWDSVYDMIGVEDSAFVNKDGYVEMCRNNPDIFGVSLSSVEDYSVYSTNGDTSNTYVMDCFSYDGESAELYFDLVKTKDGFWFFDEYGIVLEASPIQSYKIFAPANSVVNVNGVSVPLCTDTTVLNKSEEDYIAYYIDKILPGEYTLEVTCPNCKSHSDTITVYNDSGYSSSSSFSYSSSDGEMNRYFVSLYYTDAYLEEINAFALGSLTTIINYAVAYQSDISALKCYDDNAKQRVQSELNKNIKNIQDVYEGGSYTYGPVQINSIVPVENRYNSTKPFASYGKELDDFDYQYSVQYSYLETYSGFYTSDYTNTRTSTATISVQCNENGEWTISDVDFYIYR